MADLFGLSFLTGIFQSVHRTAKVVLVFKKDSKLDYSNYRPNSLLSNIAKNFCIKDSIPFSITVIVSITYNLVSDSIILHHMT